MKSLKSVWVQLSLPPIWFLLLIVVFSVYYGAAGYDSGKIPELVESKTSLILLIAQIIILASLWISSRKNRYNLFRDGWKLKEGTTFRREVLWGVLLGAAILVLYIVAISPLQVYLQEHAGDYVPPESLFEALGSQIGLFFVANVLLAPFVEESLYRNYALLNFLGKYSKLPSVIVVSIFFGLLHWSGGLWYMLITALFVGVPFGLIAANRRNIILVYTAHLTLNFLEFIYVVNIQA